MKDLRIICQLVDIIFLNNVVPYICYRWILDCEFFLQLIHDVIKTNGAEYIQKESKFAVAKSTGQMSIRYKVLLKLYEAVDIFLTAKRNDGDVIEVLEYCRIDYTAENQHH